MDRREREKRKVRMGNVRKAAEREAASSGSTCLNLPDGLGEFKPKAGTYRLEVVPYEVKAEGGPCPPGDWWYKKDFWIHWVPVAGGVAPYCCLKMWNEKCPGCEEHARINHDPDSDDKLRKALLPKHRQLWLFYNHGEPEKGVQLFNQSWFGFGKQLTAKLNNADDTEDGKEYDDFAQVDETGKTLKVSFGDEPMGDGGTFTKVVDIEFKDRKNPLPKEVVDHGYDLDAMPKRVPYAEFAALFRGEVPADKEDEDDGEAPARKPAKAAATRNGHDDDEAPAKKQGVYEEGDVVTFKYRGEYHTGEVTEVSAKNGTLQVTCDDRDRPYTLEADDETLRFVDEGPQDEGGDDEAPPPKKKPAPVKAAAPKGRTPPPEDDDDKEEDQNDDDWDD